MADCQKGSGLLGGPKDPTTEIADSPGNFQKWASLESAKLMIYRKCETVIGIPMIESSVNALLNENIINTVLTKKKKKRRGNESKGSNSQERSDGCEEVTDTGGTFMKLKPEESMYLLGCKPRVMYIKLTKPLEKDSSVFGYIPSFLPPETELRVNEEEQKKIVSQRSFENNATLHRKSNLQSDHIESKLKIWCFSTELETADEIAEMEENKEEPFGEKRCSVHKLMIAIGGKIQEVLENHYNRISEVQSQVENHYNRISEVQSQVEHVQENRKKEKKEKKKKQVERKEVDPLELDPSEMLKRELRALEYKEEELNQHTLEFLLYVKNRFDELMKATDDSRNCGTAMKRVFSLECKRLSAALPIYAKRSDIIDTIKANQVTVLVGETGCGKSTQIPQYLHEAGFASSGMIVCTQPRKIAAISLASRVAEEVDGTVGQVVGYRVGRNSRVTHMTKVLYVTDYILLNECLRDKELSSFSCIIVDEAHERSIFSDLLLGIIKECLQSRPDLRVVITSATIDPDVFVKYFRGCPVLYVTGRQFPVEIEWKKTRAREELFTKYESKAVKKAIEVHKSMEKGDILVFLTNPLETERCCETFESLIGEVPRNYVTISLHGKLQKHEQEKVFDPTPHGERKIIFATNSGETSVTIPTVRFVIDTGLVKEMVFDDACKMNKLCLRIISQSRAIQRMGRAGRLCPGKCYRLYTKEDYKDMDSASPPEIVRSNLGLALLHLMDLHVDPLEFDYVTPPPAEAIEEAYATLVSIGAVVGRRITDLGRQIAKLPLDPKYGALVYEGSCKGVGLEAIIIAAASGWNYSVLLRPKNNIIRKQQHRFHHQGGDQLTVLNVFKEWYEIQSRFKRNWCYKHSVNGRALFGIYEAAKDILHILNTQWNSNIRFAFRMSKTGDSLLASLLVKMFSRNLSYCIGLPEASYCIASKEQNVEVIQSSVTRLFDDMPKWIVFDQITNISKKDIAVTIVPVPESLLLKGIRERWLFLEVDKIKKKQMRLVCKENAGHQLVREFFAPKLDHLKNFLSVLENTLPYSEASIVSNRKKGELNVIALENSGSHISDILVKALTPIKMKLQLEKSLLCVGSKTESLRAVIGAGGTTTNILMLEECKVVIINCPERSVEEISEEEVLKLFEQYGEIEECKKFIHTKKSTLWGYVIYRNIQSVFKAIKMAKKSSDMTALPNGGSCFMKKIQWNGVCVVESGYVTFSNKKYVERAKTCNFKMCSSFGSAQFSHHEQENTLGILNQSKFVSEETFRCDLARALSISPVRNILEVRMPRINIKESEKMQMCLMSQLLDKMGELAQPDLFHLYFRAPQEGDTNLTAFCVLHDPVDASVAWKEVSKHLLLKEETCDEALYTSSIYILREIFGEYREDLLKQMEELEDGGMVVALRYCKNQDVMIYLGAECPNVLAIANGAIGSVISAAEVIDCEDDPRNELLFSVAGQKMLESVMLETNTTIIIDDRVMTISLHGSEESRERTRELLVKDIGQLFEKKILKYDLKGTGMPEGLMKYLLDEFGSELRGLEIEADLDTVELDYRIHRLKVTGPKASHAAVCELLNRCGDILSSSEFKDDSSPFDPDCVVCLYPIKEKSIYRLDCGHGYCPQCLKLHISNAINKKEFPIACIIEECRTLFVWRDLTCLANDNLFKMSSLVTASVRCFMSQHKEFQYCITPLCPLVYRVTDIGTPFTCPECRTTICTNCHTFYHSGLTCSEYKSIMEQS